MSTGNWLAEQFEANRSRLQAVAFRMLGSAAEAEDVVQEAWLRLCGDKITGIEVVVDPARIAALHVLRGG